jgi:ornithine cyclodeaminase/alanine dehydrogenase-like protein (mu-crystallin family)
MEFNADSSWINEKIKIGHELLYLTKNDVMKTGLTEEDILALTKEALVAHGRKDYEMPAKIGIHPYKEVFFHAMPAYVPAKKAAGMKWIECYPNNPERYGLPQTTGLLTINDVSSGCPIAIMDATWVTAMRTPAVTVLAAEALHPHAETFGMFGCGVQGIEHCKYVVHTLKKLKKIHIYDIREAAMDNLIKEVQPLIDVEIVKGKSPEEVTKSCEVLSSATVILLDPLAVVKDEWVRKGQTLLPCDLNTFWDPATAKRADKYIVDSSDEHKLFAEMGYFPDGMPEITCETGEVVAGVAKGREFLDELIVNSNIGMAVCDVVVGREVFNRALERGIGRVLPL